MKRTVEAETDEERERFLLKVERVSGRTGELPYGSDIRGWAKELGEEVKLHGRGEILVAFYVESLDALNDTREGKSPASGVTITHLFLDLVSGVVRRGEISDSLFVRMLNSCARNALDTIYWHPDYRAIAKQFELRAKRGVLPEESTLALEKLISVAGFSHAIAIRYKQALEARNPGLGLPMELDRTERWIEGAAADLTGVPAEQSTAWFQLIRHCMSANGSQPNAKWAAEAKRLVLAVGLQDYARLVIKWFDLARHPRSEAVAAAERNAYQRNPYFLQALSVDVLRGLAWAATEVADSEIARALGSSCESALRKLPGTGPRCPKWANACVWALGQIATGDSPGAKVALGQLVRLSTRVSYRLTLNMIEKAMNAAAGRMGMSRDDLDELGVPGFGFDAAGVRVEKLGEVTCTMRVVGGEVEVEWKNEKGKLVKSAPAAAKGAEHAEVMKEIKGVIKDAGQMLSAQRERLDRLMGGRKSWEWEAFRERYLEHGIVGAVAGRLIWVVDGRPAIWRGGNLEDVEGKVVVVSATSKVEVWHPIGRSVEEVLAWRGRLEVLGITQPFKQAHREVYLLSEAERRTGTYSNRFAGHLIRQHQFNALAAGRGWKNKLRLMVGNFYPPASKELPEWGLRAEWWVEGVGTEYGTDTNDAGVFLRLSTDQVRFYRLEAAHRMAHASGGGYAMDRNRRDAVVADEPLRMEDVPALAFSEVMRDVDLFVGVASVANDPNWADGGPGGRYRDYWHEASFGELGASAATRREVLAKLLPRMTKLAGKWELGERFLKVRGSLRAYKIHLGSGNILMEPNDQYLCIVADRSVKGGAGMGGAGGAGFLPFEGDERMSVIISKALMLAEDEKILDETITRQIGR